MDASVQWSKEDSVQPNVATCTAMSPTPNPQPSNPNPNSKPSTLNPQLACDVRKHGTALGVEYLGLRVEG